MPAGSAALLVLFLPRWVGWSCNCRGYFRQPAERPGGGGARRCWADPAAPIRISRRDGTGRAAPVRAAPSGARERSGAGRRDGEGCQRCPAAIRRWNWASTCRRKDGNTGGASELPKEPGSLGFVRRDLIRGSKMEFLTWVFPALVLLCTQQHRCIR